MTLWKTLGGLLMVAGLAAVFGMKAYPGVGHAPGWLYAAAAVVGVALIGWDVRDRSRKRREQERSGPRNGSAAS